MDHCARSGQSLIELLVGIAVGGIFVIGAATIIAPSLSVNKQAASVQMQAEFAQDMLSSVQSWANGNWNGVLALATGTANQYYLNTSSSPFTVVGPSTNGQSISNCGGSATATTCVTYQRYFYVGSVYRDSSGNVTSTATGNYYDPSTMSVNVVVSIASSTIPPLTYSLYITRSGDDVLSQTSWAGGSGQTTSTNIIGTMYASSSNITITATGSIQLASGGSSCVL